MNDGWIVHVLPRDGSRGHRLRVSPRTVRVAAGGLAVLGLLVAVWAVLFVGDVSRAEEMERLRERNRRLSADLVDAERRTDQLVASLDGLSRREERFRLMAGLPLLDPEVLEVGVGGPASGPVRSRSREMTTTLDRLLRRSQLLSASLAEAADSVRARRELFLARPSIRPVATRHSWISSSYSHSRYHPILHHNMPHEGVDISARHGAPILATARGRVVFAGWASGYGKMVEVEHGYGYRTRYAHASSLSVEKGDRIRRGDVLGAVGETGLATGPNLHYEVLVRGRPVDPRPYLLDDRVAGR